MKKKSPVLFTFLFSVFFFRFSLFVFRFSFVFFHFSLFTFRFTVFFFRFSFFAFRFSVPFFAFCFSVVDFRGLVFPLRFRFFLFLSPFLDTRKRFAKKKYRSQKNAPATVNNTNYTFFIALQGRILNFINRKIKMGQGKVSGLQHRILVRSRINLSGDGDLEAIRLRSRL